MKFKTKVEVVDARQWFPGKRVKGVVEEKECISNDFRPDKFTYLNTMFGMLKVEPGDWVITRPSGESVVMKEDVFHQNFIKVSNKKTKKCNRHVRTSSDGLWFYCRDCGESL